MNRRTRGFAVVFLAGLTFAVEAQQASASIGYDDYVPGGNPVNAAVYSEQIAVASGFETSSGLPNDFAAGQDVLVTDTLAGLDLSNSNRLQRFTAEPPAASAALLLVPEPATFAIWSSLGSLGLAIGWRRRRRS